jgi:hypothetical protein
MPDFLSGAGFSLRGYGFVAPASRRQFSAIATQSKNRRRDAGATRNSPQAVLLDCLQIKIAQRFFGGLIFCLLQRFLEFPVEHVFLLALGFP